MKKKRIRIAVLLFTVLFMLLPLAASAAEGGLFAMETERPQGIAFLVFRVKTDETSEEIGQTEADMETETETETFTETEEETEAQTEEISKAELPKVSLTKKQMSSIKQVGKVFPEIVVVFQGCVPEDELFLMDNSQVIAVVSTAEMDSAKLEEQMLVMDVEIERANYQARMEALKALRETEMDLMAAPEEITEDRTEKESETIPHIEGGGSQGLNRASSGENAEDGNGDDADLNGDSSGKDVKVLLSWDEAEDDDDTLYASLSITSVNAVTSGKITITYDQNIMTVDEVDEGEISNRAGVNLEIRDAGRGNAAEGTTTIAFTLADGATLDESVAEPYFNLKTPAKSGDKYEVAVTVEEMKNGEADLTTEVNNTPLTVGAVDEDEDETESETETRQSTTNGTGSGSGTTTANKTSMNKSAPKTGDNTLMVPFIIAAVLAAGVILLVCWQKRKKER